jgi:very-short-patch-repair endonuclease
VHPSVREGAEQAEWLDLLSPILKRDGYTFQQRGTVSGRALFQLDREIEGVAGRPKNLIFASIGPKPELGFADAINNDVVVLEHADSCLIYDRNLSDSGLLWSDLIAWWADLNDLDSSSPQTRKLLGTRLQHSLDPPEKLFFDTYFKEYAPKLKERLPALIPQVYLHYDPKTLKELQGRKRIPRQRMDFLLLLERGTRIVLEIDGRQHYADGSGKASIERYAEMVRADRSLRLSGYEVYRFGGHDFANKGAEQMIIDFFRRLFARHGIA